MDSNVTQERKDAHALLDMLSVEKLAVVRSLLAVMVESLSSALASAPVEEEEITTETAAAIDRSRSSLARGEIITHENLQKFSGHARVSASALVRRSA
ncbi:MAG TPA: hypothetical protein VI386_25050 [Candidatus Sulfotelmatobacter sp.]